MIARLVLLSSFLGSVLVIAPTFNRVERWLTDTDRIEALKAARHSLLEFERVTVEDRGFDQVRNVLSSQLPEWDWDSVAGFYPLPFGAFGGGGGWIYLFDEPDIDLDNPVADGSAERFESVLITDQWIQNEIEQLQTRPKQRVRAVGFGLLVLSVILQALVTSSL